jgi:hypothetical protein
MDRIKETFDAADSMAIFCDIMTVGVIIINELEFIIGIISGNIISIVYYIPMGLFQCA